MYKTYRKNLNSIYKHFKRFYSMGHRRVVVTGLGIVCPLGVSVQAVWQKLLCGEVGIASIDDPDFDGIPCKVAATVPRGDNPQELNLKQFKNSDFKILSSAAIYGLVAAEEALKDAGWFPQTQSECEKTGVAVGVGMVDLMDIYHTGDLLKHKGYSKVSPFFVPRILSNMTAGHIAIKYGFQGPNHSVSTACATGLHAIGDAYNFILKNQADVMVCGSTEAPINPLSIAAFSRMRALSVNFNSSPKKASRPFDKDRDGFVMAEGAGIVVLESYEHAIKRKAKIYAEILGYGLSADAYHITSPKADGDGAYRCMKESLSENGLNTTDVGYINAHATSTPLGDTIELKAIHKLFQDHSKILAVSSTKGSVGHLLGASGSIEAIFTILSCYTKQLPPNVNLDNLDTNLPINIIGKKLQTWPETLLHKRIGMTNSFGFGGTNASVIFCCEQ